VSAARGTVIRRGAKWAVVLDLGRDVDGKRIRRWHSGFDTRKDAERARTDLLGKLDVGEYVPPNRLTVTMYLTDKWLPTLDSLVAGGKLKANTAASYRHQVEAYVRPRIGHVALQDVTPDMLARLYGDLLVDGRRRVREGQSAGLSPTSVRLVHVTVHRMLKDAVRWGLLPRNPADVSSADAPKATRTGADTMRVWSPTDLRTFLASVKGDRLYAMWLLFITTGLRRGEVAGLRWSDLDLDRGRLSVNVARVVVNHTVVDTSPKSKRTRELAIDPGTVKALRSHQVAQGAERLAWGPGYNGSPLVFTWEDGRPLHPDVITRTFKRLATAAGLPVVRVHDLRHSYASAALSAGVGLKVMQERLGHSSVAITGDVYSHVSREVDQAAADQVAAVILGGAG
jgi:integrase